MAVPLFDTATPLAPLRGAIDHASQWATAHTDHVVVAVLATDGEPEVCTPTDISQIKSELSKNIKLPPGMTIEYGGLYQEQQASFRELALALAWNRKSEALDYFDRVQPSGIDERAWEWHARAALWAGDWKRAARVIAAMSLLKVIVPRGRGE